MVMLMLFPITIAKLYMELNYYEIQCDDDLIESEISQNTKIIFSITTASLIILFSLIIYLIVRVRKKIHK